MSLKIKPLISELSLCSLGFVLNIFLIYLRVEGDEGVSRKRMYLQGSSWPRHRPQLGHLGHTSFGLSKPRE